MSSCAWNVWKVIRRKRLNDRSSSFAALTGRLGDSPALATRGESRDSQRDLAGVTWKQTKPPSQHDLHQSESYAQAGECERAPKSAIPNSENLLPLKANKGRHDSHNSKQ